MATVDEFDVWRRERYKTVLDLRAQGATYREIGDELHITGGRVTQLAKQARREFYRRLDVPIYHRPEPHPPRMTRLDLYVLYQLKDFLEEIAK